MDEKHSQNFLFLAQATGQAKELADVWLPDKMDRILRSGLVIFTHVRINFRGEVSQVFYRPKVFMGPKQD